MAAKDFAILIIAGRKESERINMRGNLWSTQTAFRQGLATFLEKVRRALAFERRCRRPIGPLGQANRDLGSLPISKPEEAEFSVSRLNLGDLFCKSQASVTLERFSIQTKDNIPPLKNARRRAISGKLGDIDFTGSRCISRGAAFSGLRPSTCAGRPQGPSVRTLPGQLISLKKIKILFNNRRVRR